MNNMISVLFTPSGCLTGDALLLYVNGTLKGSELIRAQQHVSACALCADAVDGLRLWLSENNSTAPFSSGMMEKTDAESIELTQNQPGIDKNKTQSALPGDFKARTDEINERLRQRLQSHISVEKTEYNRFVHHPLAWLSAAATILLFIGGGYVIWMQRHSDSQELAQKMRLDSILNPIAFGTTGYDALPFPPSQSTAVLTIKYDRKKRDKVPPVLAIVTDGARITASGNVNLANAEEHVEFTKSQRSQAAEEREEDYNESVYKRDHPVAVVRRGGAAMRNEDPADESESLYAFVNEMPSFPGGDTERKRFFAKHIRYPLYAAENDIQGNIVVGFIVKKDGSLANVKILHGIGGGCDEEALRVVKMMPPWKPGYQNGKKANVLVTMPVYFKLQ
jgi:TonB family protein